MYKHKYGFSLILFHVIWHESERCGEFSFSTDIYKHELHAGLRFYIIINHSKIHVNIDALKDSIFPQFINISKCLDLIQTSEGVRAGKVVVSMETQTLLTSLE